MGMMTRVKRWLGPRESRTAPRDRRPVAIDLHTNGNGTHAPGGVKPAATVLRPERHEDPDAELAGFDPAPAGHPPRSRQELIAELQKNYQEVLGIVRRVDGHLDTQGRRSERFAEIAERVPAACDDLAGVRREQGRAVEAIESLALAVREGDSRLTEAQLAQVERLEELRGLMAESSAAERELIGSLIEFRDVMTSVTGATEQLTGAVRRMEDREAERAGQMLRALESTRAWMTTLAVIGGVCALAAVTLGIAAMG